MKDAPIQNSMTYRDAGVDIDAGNRLVSMIKGMASATHRRGVRSDLGGYGALFELDLNRYRNPILVSTTDGVGTKLKLAFLMDQHHTVGIDLVAMSVNDLVVQGAEPLFFLDYFATGKLKPEIAATVIQGIADGCKQAGCALVGGETAEMPGFYQDGEYDLAGFAVGVVDRPRIIDGRSIAPGDQVLGLASSGPHSNGYSLIRKLVLENNGPGLDFPFAGGSLGQALLTPTRIYVRPLLTLLEEVTIKGMAHITGGGFWENIPRVLPENVVASLRPWPTPPIFTLLQELGHITDDEMLRTFNCGIGMILIVAEGQTAQAMESLRNSGEEVHHLGQITPRQGHEHQVTIHG